jgi:pyruvate-formate lyase
LKEAKENPNSHPNLLVRVSGYSAYFKTLNKAMQDELITRSQYNLSSGKFVSL